MGTGSLGVASEIEKGMNCDESWQLFGHQSAFPRTDLSSKLPCNFSAKTDGYKSMGKGSNFNVEREADTIVRPEIQSN